MSDYIGYDSKLTSQPAAAKEADMNAASIFVQMIGLIGAAVALQRTFRKARAASDVLLIFLKLDDARQYGAAACVFVIVWLALSLVHQLIS